MHQLAAKWTHSSDVPYVTLPALGGTANSVSSAEQSQAHASTNTFVAGDDIVLTVSSNSSCADMSFSIKYTRTLD